MASMFKLHSSFLPRGDQPQAIKAISSSFSNGKKKQVLLGVTGSGKTFSMAHILKNLALPTLILAHNKTLAAQLYEEFSHFFPDNAVEYFVSYYDYYQPEAYIPRSDTFIEKDLAINEHIERMRLSATKSLIERKDVIVISSVSCIYGIGSSDNFKKMMLNLDVGKEISRDELLLNLISLQYKRNDTELLRSSFRVRGDTIDIIPSYEQDRALRVELYNDQIERISVIDPLTSKRLESLSHLSLFAATHFVTPKEDRLIAINSIKDELALREAFFSERNLHVEQQRICERTRYDLEMIKEVGFCKGIENYSRHFTQKAPGEPPECLMDYFPKDYLLIVDESHQTIPQVRAMYNGDRARKKSLIDFGFRLPSAFDNRPLQFDEFMTKLDHVLYVSATPAPFEIEEAGGEIAQQIIRPTGLLDPTCTVKPLNNQVDESLEEIRKETLLRRKTLVTTLTKKMAEDLTKYLTELSIRAKYLHSDVDTLDRIKIISDLREDKFDVLIGINLLREGLDIPEVSLVIILDADKEGFLRSETALIQTCGRASRNLHGRVILFADKITNSIQKTLNTAKERRSLQEKYNKSHNITPTQITKKSQQTILTSVKDVTSTTTNPPKHVNLKLVEKKKKTLKRLMKKAADSFQFEEAAKYRDEIRSLETLELL